MPLSSVDPNDVPRVRTLAMEEREERKEVSVSWGKAFATGFARENILSSFIRYNRGHPGEPTTEERELWLSGEFDPLERIKGTKYEKEPYLTEIARARTPAELEWIQGNIDRLERNEEIMARAGTGKALTAGMTGALLDPILAPALGIPVIRGSLLAKTSGTATVASGLAGVSEAGLHATQPTRTKTESAVNIGASALLGSLLGTLGPRTAPEEAARMRQNLEDEIKGEPLFGPDTTFRPVGRGPVDEGFVDPTKMNWHDLRRYAKIHGISAGGKRADIEAELLDLASERGPLLPENEFWHAGEFTGGEVTNKPLYVTRIKEDAESYVMSPIAGRENSYLMRVRVEDPLNNPVPQKELYHLAQKHGIDPDEDVGLASVFDPRIHDEDKIRALSEDLRTRGYDHAVLDDWNLNAEEMESIALFPGTKTSIVEPGPRISEPQFDPMGVQIKPDGSVVDRETGAVYSGPDAITRSVGAAVAEGGTLPPGFRTALDENVRRGELTQQEAAKIIRDKELEWTALKNEAMFKAFKFGSPVLRVALSKSPKARDLLENLIEDSFIRQKNMYGHTADFAVETRIKAHSHVKEAQLYDIVGSSYQEYVGATSAIGRVAKRMRNKDIMSMDDFSGEVGKAMARGDVHDIPEVAQAAKSIRKNISEPLERELVREKLIPTDAEGNPKPPVGGDESYFPRVYDWGKIAGDRAGFKAHLKAKIRDRIVKANEGRPDAEGRKAFDDPQFQRELDARLDDTIERIIGSPHGYMPRNIVPQTGFLKKRKITLGFDDLEPWLVTDAIQVQRSYIRNVLPQLEIKKRFSGVELDDEIEAINREYTQAMENLKPHSREMRQMEKERKQVIGDIQAMRDIMLHRYERPRNPSSMWNQAGHAARALNFMRALGGVTVSSIPDMGQTIARMGVGVFARSFVKLALSPKAMNISRAEAKRMGAGLDAILHTRANLLMMASDESVSPVNKLTRNLDKGVRGFSKVSGMSYWNSGLKQFAAIMYADEIGRMAARGGTLTRGQRARLAAAHISEEDWSLIVQNFQKHGSKEGGIWIPNIDQWDDAARDTFSSALLKEVDTSVVTPGAGDLPLAARTPVGKVIAQFKSFILTAHNRIFLAGMQRTLLDPQGAVNQASGFMAMMALGTMAYALKSYAAGREPETDNLNTLAREALSHSGYLGYMVDVNALTEKATRGTIGLSSVFGHMGLGEAEPLTRYHTRSVVEDLLGPTMGTANDAVIASSAIINKSLGEDINESDIRAIRRLMPYQNLIYIRRMLNEVEEGAADRWAR